MMSADDWRALAKMVDKCTSERKYGDGLMSSWFRPATFARLLEEKAVEVAAGARLLVALKSAVISPGETVETAVIAGTSFRAKDPGWRVDDFGGPVPCAKPAKPGDHPAPWAWNADDGGLYDSEGGDIIWGVGDRKVAVSSVVVREMLRLAPEMEAMLRSFEWRADTRWIGGCCPSCNARRGAVPSKPTSHFSDCKLAALLAAIDAARAVKT